MFVSERDAVTGNWSHPVNSADNIAVAGSDVREPRVSMGSNGDAVIAWYQSDGTNWQIFKSERDGTTGNWVHPANLSDNISPNGSTAYFHRVAVNGSSDTVVVWRQYDTANNLQIFMSERDGSTGNWTHPADRTDNISPDGTIAREREIDMDDSGHTVIAWLQNITGGSRMFMSERNDSSAGWTHPTDLTDYISPDGGSGARPPYVAVGGNGNAILVWPDSNGSRDQLYMSEKY